MISVNGEKNYSRVRGAGALGKRLILKQNCPLQPHWEDYARAQIWRRWRNMACVPWVKRIEAERTAGTQALGRGGDGFEPGAAWAWKNTAAHDTRDSPGDRSHRAWQGTERTLALIWEKWGTVRGFWEEWHDLTHTLRRSFWLLGWECCFTWILWEHCLGIKKTQGIAAKLSLILRILTNHLLHVQPKALIYETISMKLQHSHQ